MPAVGVVVAAAGARHILHSLPLVAPIDLTLSDSRFASGRQPGHWVLKPYVFHPHASLQSERIGIRTGKLQGVGSNFWMTLRPLSELGARSTGSERTGPLGARYSAAVSR